MFYEGFLINDLLLYCYFILTSIIIFVLKRFQKNSKIRIGYKTLNLTLQFLDNVINSFKFEEFQAFLYLV